MPYRSGQTPAIGDHVKHTSGKFGKITRVTLHQKDLWGEDVVRIQWDDGGVAIGNALGCEFDFVSRSEPSEAAEFQSFCPECKQFKTATHDRVYLKVALEQDEEISVTGGACGHSWNLREQDKKNLFNALRSGEM